MDDETRASFEDLRRALSVEFGLIAARFDAVDRRFDAVEQRVEAVRREMGVLIEGVRHEVRTVAEMVVGNPEAISELRARIGAR